MPPKNSWLAQPRLWVEAFVLANLAFLSFDIYLAHSVNQFHEAAEYIPLYFSAIAPAVLLIGLLAYGGESGGAAWRDLGLLVGWLSVAIGLAGVVLHLDSQFFVHTTLKSLVYAAPFAAPLAYTGLGLLLIMNRLVEERTTEWAMWVILLAWGGFVGNFVFSLTDHAQNGFFHFTEWIPVFSSAMAIGFLGVPFFAAVDVKFLRWCLGVLLMQAAVGVLGFGLHAAANLDGPSPSTFENFVYGTPAMAPLLFPNLVLLALIGLWALYRRLPAA